MIINEYIKVGIVGAAGYTAGELLRILANHPAVKVVFAQSGSHAGEPVWSAHQDLLGETDLKFSAEAPVEEADVIFLTLVIPDSGAFGFDGSHIKEAIYIE